jgi:transposase
LPLKAFKEQLPAIPHCGGEERMNMSERVCGVDVHRDSLVATIISEPSKETRRFVNDVDDINSMKEWLNEHECRRVAMESSGIYWVPLYLALEEASLDALLANAHQVKRVPGRKTDQSDSEWLAFLLRSGLIKPSYVPEKRVRELRDLTRLRVKHQLSSLG